MKKHTIRVGTDRGWYEITPTFPHEAALHIADIVFTHTPAPWVEVWDDDRNIIEVWADDDMHPLSEESKQFRDWINQDEIEGTPF